MVIQFDSSIDFYNNGISITRSRIIIHYCGSFQKASDYFLTKLFTACTAQRDIFCFSWYISILVSNYRTNPVVVVVLAKIGQTELA